MNLLRILAQGDGVTRLVALLLLAMSVASWVLIFCKGWLLARAGGDLARGTAAFWQAASLDEAIGRLERQDRHRLLLPLAVALEAQPAGTLAATEKRAQQLTRRLRDALHGVSNRLQSGQVLLASVGATAPFVGLLGTVWGIRHALGAIAEAGQISIERVAAPVGESLVMTAAGIAVALPAVLAYNVFGRRIGRIEAELEGFAFDLRELPAASPAA